MRRLVCCFGKGRRRTETSAAGNNAGVQNAEQQTLSDSGFQNVERQTTSNLAAVRFVHNLEQQMMSHSSAQTTDQPSTSNPSDAREVFPEIEAIGEDFPYEELSPLLPKRFDLPFLDSFHKRSDEVFVGTLRNQKVALKSLTSRGFVLEEFEAAISALKEANHPNLIKPIGCCIKGDGRLLIYQIYNFVTLDSHLFDHNKEPLNWNTRMKIALGSAKGLEYLHKTMNPPVVHRNIKAKNVFVDDEFVPKLFDFGLPKKAPNWREKIMWNFGYEGWVGPEYLETRRLTFESDVYSFGVLLLVIVTGREAYNQNELDGMSIAAWARSTWNRNKDVNDIVDPRMEQRYPKEIAYSYLETALSCINPIPSSRPDISNVCRRLECIASGPYDHTAESSQAGEKKAATPSSSA